MDIERFVLALIFTFFGLVFTFGKTDLVVQVGGIFRFNPFRELWRFFTNTSESAQRDIKESAIKLMRIFGYGLLLIGIIILLSELAALG